MTCRYCGLRIVWVPELRLYVTTGTESSACWESTTGRDHEPQR